MLGEVALETEDADARGLCSTTAADGKTFGGRDRLKSETLHRLAETARHLGDELRVGVVRRRLDDGLRALGWIARLEDPRAHEVALGAELHHERPSAGVAMPPAQKRTTGSFCSFANTPHEIDGHAVLRRLLGQLVLVHVLQRHDL